MRVKEVHLHGYKRFSDLTVTGIPPNCRLVVLIGPNGSGKSSLFDAFLMKGQYEPAVRNIVIDDDQKEYYYRTLKVAKSERATRDLWQHVDIQFHDVSLEAGEWASTFNIRSPYRNEHQFKVDNLARVAPASEQQRFKKIIEPDRAVSDNFRRLGWQRQNDLDSGMPDNTTFGDYRTQSLAALQDALELLFPGLKLQDFGGITSGAGFRFTKGAIADFAYQNLSGGEKAAFDLLLDIFVKRNEFQDAVYCIDEPEAHMSVAVQGKLLEALMSMLPDESQLWVATHSIGIVRAAQKRSDETKDVVFLDFSGHDFDQPVTLQPVRAGRQFWRATYELTLDDLAALIGPARIILCEGRREEPLSGFDAEYYNKLFGETHGDTLFLSRGGAKEVEKSSGLIAIIESIIEGADLVRLTDRDDMTEEGRVEKLSDPSLRILSRRELENYLYDPEVLRTFFARHGVDEIPVDISRLVADSPMTEVKSKGRQILDKSRSVLPGEPLGNSLREFALAHLVPALMCTPAVLSELEADIFPQSRASSQDTR